MGLFDSLKSWVTTGIWKDNTTEDITPAKLREGVFAFADQIEQLLAVIRSSSTWKTVTAVTANDRSWPITLSNPGNKIGAIIVTDITKKAYLQGAHFTITGTGTSRVIQITDSTIDKFQVGEKIYYEEVQAGTDLNFSTLQIGIISQGGQNKFAWKMPAEADASYRPFANVPTGYSTDQINHADPGMGTLPLRTFLARFGFISSWILSWYDNWLGAGEGQYRYDNQNSDVNDSAPRGIFTSGRLQIMKLPDGGKMILVYPQKPRNGLGPAYMVQHSPTDPVTWNNLLVKDTKNVFERVLVGTGNTDPGGAMAVNGTIYLNGVDTTKKTKSLNVAYTRDTWIDLLVVGADLELNATYILTIRFDIYFQIYNYAASGVICTSTATNDTAAIPVTLNGIAHAVGTARFEFRWLLSKTVDGVTDKRARLQFRTQQAFDYSNNLPIQITYQRIF